MLKITLRGTPYEKLALQYCNTTEEAVEYAANIQTAKAGDNIVFLDKKGVAEVIEKAPTGFQVRKSENRLVCCTNTFVHEHHSHHIDDSSERYKRHLALEDLLSQRQLSEQTMKTILSHKEGDYPVCRKTTQVSFMAFPEQLTLKVSDGKPTPEGYQDFILTL